MNDHTLSWPTGPVLRNVAALVRYRIGETSSTLRLTEPNCPIQAPGLQAFWRQEPAPNGYQFWLELTASGEAPIYLETTDVLTARAPDLGAPPATWRVYQNGWQSWSPTFVRHLEGTRYADPGTPEYRAAHQPHWEPDYDGLISSEWVAVLFAPPATALLLGFLTAKDQLAEIRLRADGSELTARCHLDSVLLAPGASLRTEVLWVAAGPDPLRLLEAWAEAIAREMGARAPHPTIGGEAATEGARGRGESPPTGWCTWYYFYGENTADDILDNLRAIANHRLPLDVILIDDGYQTAIGDWFSIQTDKFPDGMEPVAEAVRAAGHRLGIWTAPFGAAATSQLFATHPDWVVRDESGAPVVGWVHWGVPCYALDCTHPEVLAWLEETFRRMRREWGATFFKIDFLFAAARPGRRYDPTATRAQALRRGVEAIRNAIGDDAFLLGCGAPLGPCIGLVDGMRIGTDVDPNWHPIFRYDLSAVSTENALRNSITRAPFHNRLWLNDPDCLLVRQRGPDLDLVLNEVRTLTAVIALLGGLTINSDNLALIRPGRLKYLRQALPPTGISARPLDLFEHEMPRLLLLPVERDWGRWWVAGVINWEDRTVETPVRLIDLGLPAGRYHVFHYWRRRYLGVTDDTVILRRHQPHETAVLLLKPVSDRPDLLTTTFHVCQGAVEVADCRWDETHHLLYIALEKAGVQYGEVWLTAPEPWETIEVRVNGERHPWVSPAPGILRIGLTLEGRSEVTARFRKR
ncbi:MAG: alpha-galactosidase [Anaerolineae bacterium]|nr:alpha-galactosidase [Anaerolineae bacterium]MDW8068941.1 alpha-galactosidase [Anaerolineae bacterium]